MKKISLLIGKVFLLFGVAEAQMSYGVRAGVNLGKITDYIGQIHLWTFPEETTNFSFHVTGYADIPVRSRISIQSGLSFQGKGAKYDINDVEWSEYSGTMALKLFSVEIPVNLVYTIPVADIGGVFLGAGPYVGINLSGKDKAKVPGLDLDLSTDVTFTGEYRHMDRIDIGLNFLGGYKFNNGFLIHVGYGLGLSDMSPRKRDTWGSWRNRVLSFGAGFEF